MFSTFNIVCDSKLFGDFFSCDNVQPFERTYKLSKSDSSSSFSEILTSSFTSKSDNSNLDESYLEQRFNQLGLLNSSDSSDEENDFRYPLLRSTSLKTPSSLLSSNNRPRRKKVVRFADSLGLEFEYVKLISCDEIPKVPLSAFMDLKLPKEEMTNNNTFSITNNATTTNATSTIKYNRCFIPEFIQPVEVFNFEERVKSNKVLLEKCEISTGAGNLSITCFIRVLNVSFTKQVTVRHTLTEWSTWNDSLASYLPNSSNGWSDKFVVTFSIRSSTPNGNLMKGQRLKFAIRYVAENNEYWDNNFGLNYSLLCIECL